VKHARTVLAFGAALACTGVLAQDKKAPSKVEQQLVQALSTPAPKAKGKSQGQLEFENSCAMCHGLAGKGMGPYSDSLKRSPPDLTMLAKRNGSVFPLQRVYEVIEGAEASHGPREMPIWGQRYRIDAAAFYVDVDYNPEVFVRGRILSLIDYLNQLQQR